LHRKLLLPGQDRRERRVQRSSSFLAGRDLGPAEQAAHLKRRKEIYERAHPETKHGATGRDRNPDHAARRVQVMGSPTLMATRLGGWLRQNLTRSLPVSTIHLRVTIRHEIPSSRRPLTDIHWRTPDDRSWPKADRLLWAIETLKRTFASTQSRGGRHRRGRRRSSRPTADLEVDLIRAFPTRKGSNTLGLIGSLRQNVAYVEKMSRVPV
jgi:hypothetical protein